MSIKLSGYTCDKCDVIVVPSPIVTDAIRSVIHQLPEGTMFRIWCPQCSISKKYAEDTMRLKDVGDVHNV